MAEAPRRRELSGDLEQRLAQLSKEFHDDLVFSMARGALELFNSNVLKFLLDNYPLDSKSVRKLFDSNAESDDQLNIYRERMNMDLVAESESSRWVVENKVFSIPNREQLKRYIDRDIPWKSGTKPHFEPKVQYSLLSMFNPQFDLETVTRKHNKSLYWHLVTYEQLFDALDDLKLDAFASKDAPLIDRYRDLICRLLGLKDAVDPAKFSAEPFVTDFRDESVRNTWIASSAMKLRASAAAEAIGGQSGPELRGDFGVGFSNGNYTLQYFCPAESSKKSIVAWQVQGTQLRLAMVFDERGLHGRTPENKRRRVERAEANWQDWFAFKDLEPILDPAESRPREKDGWNHFAPSMIYKKRHIRADATNEEVLATLAKLTKSTDEYAQLH